MLRKRRWILVLSVLTPVLCLILILLALRPSAVDEAAFKRIKDGMTKSEVEGILGGNASASFEDTNGSLGIWEGRDGEAQILFDMTNRVSGKIWIYSNETLPDKIWRRVFLLPIKMFL